MTNDDERFLRAHFNRFDPLSDAHKAAHYLPLYTDRRLSPTDPIHELLVPITWGAAESYQLFTGFSGTGKTTELRRLQRELTAEGAPFVVLHIDTKRYLNLDTPIDVSDFLFAAAGAVDEALAASDKLTAPVSGRSGWTRMGEFLTRTTVNLAELSLSGEPAGVGASLKLNLHADPSFKQRLQEKMAGHLGALTDEVHDFFRECVQRIKAAYGPEWQLVVLFDSLEQLRGTGANAREVEASAVILFQVHAEKLHLPGLHVIYTVPPWLKIRAPAVAAGFTGAQQIPCVKVRDLDGAPWRPGIDALIQLVAMRMPDWHRLFGGAAPLEDLILASGGYLRDLLRLVQAAIRLSRMAPLPVTEEVIALAKAEVRTSYLPLTVEDAYWLTHIAETHACDLGDTARLAELARLYANMLVLTYRNGEEWVNAHPLVIDAARAMVKRNPRPADA